MFIERPTNRSTRGLVLGVGINDTHYVLEYVDAQGVRQRCPYYRVWVGLLDRCFNPAFLKRRPSYAGCTMDPTWLTFSTFKTWMQAQAWEGNHLDKDLLSKREKHYSPSTCLFISPALNNLLTLSEKTRGGLPLGVSLMKTRQYTYIVASCSFYGTQTRLGYFKTVEEAAEAYKQAKLAYIAELAQAEPDPRIKQALLALY